MGNQLLQRIRTELHKPARSYVSITKLCAYTRLPEAKAHAALNRSQRQAETFSSHYAAIGDSFGVKRYLLTDYQANQYHENLQ